MDASIAGHGGGHGGIIEHHEETSRKLRVGIGLYVLVDVTFVASLFAAYIFLRTYNTQGMWFKGIKPPSFGGQALLTLALVLSGVLYFIGERTLRVNNQSIFRLSMLVALVLMFVTLVGEIIYLGHLPFTTTDGAFASSFIMLSAYHVFHMLIAIPIGFGLVNRALHARYRPDNTVGITVIGYYWYWTVIMGLALWLLVIVLPPQI